jgi:putative ABC transport system substrate-binding protein
MRRREFIAGLGSAAVAWPPSARAQQSGVPVVGLLSPQSANGGEIVVAPFRRGLQESGGFIEGRNVIIEYRWAENQSDRLPALAADLVRRRVAVIAAYSDESALAAKAATATIPIAFAIGGDPVSEGLVASLNRPGGNATGFAGLRTVLVPKQLQLLRELIPDAALIGFLVDPARPNTETDTNELAAAADTMGQRVLVLNAGNDGDLENAFATFVRQGARGVVLANSAFYNRRTVQLAVLAARFGLPTISPAYEYATAGGLMSYGSSFDFGFRQGGIYVGRILKGANPADLPVEQATKIGLILNLRTAKAFGLTIPLPLLALADEVIE